MRIALVTGTVTLSRCHPTFNGASLRVAVPLTLEELKSGAVPSGEELIVWDDLGSAPGCHIALSEGGEAAQPFRPDEKPVDAYNAAIIDEFFIN